MTTAIVRVIFRDEVPYSFVGALGGAGLDGDIEAAFRPVRREAIPMTPRLARLVARRLRECSEVVKATAIRLRSKKTSNER